MKTTLFLLFLYVACTSSLLPPKFQWKSIDYAWKDEKARKEAICTGDYIPRNNMPAGLARWRNKLFIVVPRWKKGVVSSLNYIDVDGPENQPLHPYPSWEDGYVSDSGRTNVSESSVISAFRCYVDEKDRLWVVDNGVSDMNGQVVELAAPAIVIFDLNTDKLIRRYVLPSDVYTDSSVMSSIAVEVSTGNDEDNTHAYITDMGSKSIIVYSFKENNAWRVKSDHFIADPSAGKYRIGGVNFYWHDGVSSAALVPGKGDKNTDKAMDGDTDKDTSKATAKDMKKATDKDTKKAKDKDANKATDKADSRTQELDLYFHATSSTKLFKIPTNLLKNRQATQKEISDGIELVGDRGPKSQACACDYDKANKVIFFTQLSKNGVGCWNIEKPCDKDTTPLVISDCLILEFPNDVKVDNESNVWILSDRQSRFLYGSMDFNEVNFRVLTAPVKKVIEGSECGIKEKKNSTSNAEQHDKKKATGESQQDKKKKTRDDAGQ